mgnify:CR=1 FL=1
MVRADEGPDAPIEAQTGLREEAASLVRLVDAEGWRLAPTAGEQARSFLGRLIGGGESEAAGPDPVEAYLETADSGDPAGDLIRLTAKAETVVQRANAVAGASRPLTVASLERDIAAAESALGAVRAASAFFAEAGARTTAPSQAFAQRLADLKSAEGSLAETADALAARRWAQDAGALTG